MSKQFRDGGNVRGYPVLSAEQIHALRSYRNTKGRQWKNKLLSDWRNASLTGVLHALRNTHGPIWLHKMQLKVI